jgi:hypothetical protein
MLATQTSLVMTIDGGVDLSNAYKPVSFWRSAIEILFSMGHVHRAKCVPRRPYILFVQGINGVVFIISLPDYMLSNW